MSNLPAKIDNQISVCPHPLRAERQDMAVPMGLTVEQMIRFAQPDPRLRGYAHVWVDGRYVPAKSWQVVRPIRGQCVEIRMVPRGGGGGGGGKDPMRTVMTVAVVAAAAVASAGVGGFIASGTWMGSMQGAGALAYAGAAAAGAAVSIAGRMAINAIAPPPSQGMPSPSDGLANEQPTYTIENARNRARAYEPIRKIIGTHRVVPDKAAKEFTEIAGNNTYLRMVFCWGYGPLQWDEIPRIGETPIDQFDEVEYNHRPGYSDDSPLQLYPNTVNEESLQILLQESDGWFSRRTEPDTDEIVVDITFPQLVEFDDKGNRTSRTVEVEVEYTEVGGTYSNVHTFTVSQATSSRISRAYRWTVARSQYDVRLRRITADTNDTQIRDKVYWTALRTFTNEDPVQMSGVALTEVRIKATDQLNGVIDKLNGTVTSILPKWDSGSGSWVEQATSNPAAGFRSLLQGNGMSDPLADSRLDLIGLQDWSEYCDSEGFSCNLVFERRKSVRQHLNDIASTGRASVSVVDGNWGVVIDKPRSTIAQHVTPRNSWGYTGSKEFNEVPHAFKVRFTNQEKGYRQDTRIVYRDGYDSSNATEFEEMQLPGVTDPDLAWRHGRYHLAVALLRPENHSFKMDPEHLVANRGDLIKFAHTVPLFGIKSARVKSISDTDSDGDIEQATVDDIFPMDSDKTYFVRFRLADGTSLLKEIETDPGEQNTVTFVTPEPEADAPEDGDLCMFGETDLESVDMIIKSVEPTNDLNAKITCVDAAPAVHDADTGTIPAFDSQITEPAFIDPPQPSIQNVRSDETVLVERSDGLLDPRILVDFTIPAGFRDFVIGFERQYRDSSEENWTSLPDLGSNATSFFISDVESNYSYDIRIRSVSSAGEVSSWAEVTSHVVVGKSTPPPDVKTLYTEGEGSSLIWAYPNAPKDLDYFEVRQVQGAVRNWGLMSVFGAGFQGPPVDVSTLGTDKIWTFAVKAVDTAGNYSTNAAFVVKGLGDRVRNIILEYDVHPEWPGTIINGSVVNGDLVPDDSGVVWIADEDQVVWRAEETYLWWAAQYKKMVYTTEFYPTVRKGKDPGRLIIDLDITSPDHHEVEIRPQLPETVWYGGDDRTVWIGGDDSYLWWDATPGEWLTWQGALDILNQDYDIRLTTYQTTNAIRAEALTLKLDVPDVTEFLNDVSIGSDGARLPVTKDFENIKNVRLILQDDAGDAITLKIADKDTTGPLVYAYDTTNTKTSAVIDAKVDGY